MKICNHIHLIDKFASVRHNSDHFGASRGCSRIFGNEKTLFRLPPPAMAIEDVRATVEQEVIVGRWLKHSIN